MVQSYNPNAIGKQILLDCKIIEITKFCYSLGADFEKLKFIIRDYFDVNVLCMY